MRPTCIPHILKPSVPWEVFASAAARRCALSGSMPACHVRKPSFMSMMQGCLYWRARSSSTNSLRPSAAMTPSATHQQGPHQASWRGCLVSSARLTTTCKASGSQRSCAQYSGMALSRTAFLMQKP